ncbi:hypothetical protein A499_06375 [Niallia nealsonii AAU1]|nr:hypothetical protein A499_06375 [Niallia nealsonii AAU1]
MNANGKSNEELMDHIIKIASETAIDYYKQREKEQKRKRVDRRLRNTRLLLANYKNFKIHCTENAVKIDHLLDPNDFEFLEYGDLVIESIVKSKKRTISMVAYLDHMLEVYRAIADSSNKKEDMRKYHTILKYYILDPRVELEDIANVHGVSVKTVKRDLDNAIKSIAALIFGVDSVRFID